MKHKIAVAASGSGRSLENLIKVGERLNFEVNAVILSRADCLAHDIAKRSGIDIFIESFPLADVTKLASFLKKHSCELVVLAGFLKPFPTMEMFENKVLNIHPALLPAYGGKGMYGMNIHRAVHNANEHYSGATVHLVNEEYDKGRKLSQIRIDISSFDSAEEIAQEIFNQERSLLPFTITKYLNDINFEHLNLTKKELEIWAQTKL